MPSETVTVKLFHLTLPQLKAWLLSGMLYAYLSTGLQEGHIFARSDKNSPAQVLSFMSIKPAKYIICGIIYAAYKACLWFSVLKTGMLLIRLPAASPQNYVSSPFMVREVLVSFFFYEDPLLLAILLGFPYLSLFYRDRPAFLLQMWGRSHGIWSCKG